MTKNHKTLPQKSQLPSSTIHQLKKLIATTKLNYKIRTTNTPTLPNLSVKLLEKFSPTIYWKYTHNITQIQINKSYRGGTIILNTPKGKKVWIYDINSLYPFCFINKIPIGHPKIVHNPNLKHTFGFIEAIITPPNFIYNNILTFKTTDKKSWKGIYFSEELKLAKKLGYQIQPKKAYIYKYTHNITQDFILHIYQNKKTSPKLTKIILNNLYGKLASNYNTSKYSNPLITAAASITSYARILMQEKLNHNNNPLLYSDTDSITVQHPHTHTHHQKIGLAKNVLKTKKNMAFATKLIVEKKRIYKYTHNIRTTTKGNNLSPPLLQNKRNWIYINKIPIIFIQIKNRL